MKRTALLCLCALLLAACGQGETAAGLPAPRLGSAVSRAADALAEPLPDLFSRAQDIQVPEPQAEPEPEPQPEPEPPVLAKFQPLLARNPYLAGWLTIGDTGIDHPVLYSPRDQNFFLNRDFDGRLDSMGSLFLAIPWREENNAALIYGHNAGGDRQFGVLLRYADEAYGRDHSVLRFDTLHGEHEYRLLGAFYSEIYEASDIEGEDERQELDNDLGTWSTLQDLDLTAPYPDYDIYRSLKDIKDGKFRYYWYTDLSDRGDFEYYVDQVKAAALYDTGAEAKWGDRLLTLSTCAYQKENGRFVVVAVEKRTP